MEQNPSWEAVSYPCRQEIPLVWWDAERFIAVCTRALHRPSPWTRLIVLTPSQSISLRSLFQLVLFSHLSLGRAVFCFRIFPPCPVRISFFYIACHILLSAIHRIKFCRKNDAVWADTKASAWLDFGFEIKYHFLYRDSAIYRKKLLFVAKSCYLSQKAAIYRKKLQY